MNERERTITLAKMAALAAIVFALAFAGCARKPPKITLHKARVEFSQGMMDEASIYLTIDNAGGPDKLLGARVSLPGATAAIHQMKGGGMTMAKEFDIPANSSTEFKSGSSHIMIMGLPADVNQGTNFTLTLKFEKSGEISLPLTFNSPRPKQKPVEVF